MCRSYIAIALLGLAVAACSSEQNNSESGEVSASSGRQALTVTYDGSECSYRGPKELKEGPLDVTFVNDSDIDVGLGVRRLRDGVTYDELKAAVRTDLPAPHHLAKAVLWLHRGSKGLEPRGELSETIFASKAMHALVCVLQTSYGTPKAFSHAGVVPVDAAGV